MDETTKSTMNSFLDYINIQLHEHKHYKNIQFGKWSLHDNKVTLEFLYQDEHRKIYVDLREIKENKDRFDHLTNYILFQLDQQIHLKGK